MLKVKVFILSILGAIVFISDIIITPYKITYADRPILGFIGVIFVSYIDQKIAGAKNHKKLRKLFYSSIIIFFIISVAINIFFKKPISTFPFIVGCFIQTVIYLRALKRADKMYSDKDIKIYEAPIPGIGYKIMSVILFIRDWFLNHKNILESAGIKEGSYVLDYGCGPGAFTFAASKIVKEGGMVYALDNQHLSVESINRKVNGMGIKNIKTIYTNQGETGLDDGSVDFVLLIGVLHLIRNPKNVLNEIKRVMKYDASLLVVSVHMTQSDLDRMIYPEFKIVDRINQMDILKKDD